MMPQVIISGPAAGATIDGYLSQIDTGNVIMKSSVCLRPPVGDSLAPISTFGPSGPVGVQCTWRDRPE